MLIHRKEILIEWGDCDPFGIVFFPRYFEYFDGCTNALFHRALGFPKAEMLKRFQIAGIPLVQASCNFFVPSSYGDLVNVESSVTNWGTSSFTSNTGYSGAKPLRSRVLKNASGRCACLAIHRRRRAIRFPRKLSRNFSSVGHKSPGAFYTCPAV